MDALERFVDDLKRGANDPNVPPHVISAGKLDRNYRRCYPKKIDGNSPPYKVDASDDGWRLIPATTFDVCENGKPVKYRFMAERV
jgi:hypothetical protein